MPELPEVETIRRDLEKKIIGKKIVGVWLAPGKTARDGAKAFQTIEGQSFGQIERIGKLLMFGIKKSDKWMLVHLKMTGQLIYVAGKRVVAGGHSWRDNDFILPNKHTRVIFSFANGGKLFFNDQRKFGYLQMADADEKREIVKNRFGFEPGQENFQLALFRRIFKNRRTSVKAILLNQKLIAGLGNIYADEACFAARIRPMRKASDLSANEIEGLFRAIGKVIKKAIQCRGTTFNSYRDADGHKGNFVKYLQVYGRGGKQCQQCGEILRKTRVVGRGTVYCAECQR